MLSVDNVFWKLSNRIQIICVVFGTILVNAGHGGIIYTFGNIIPYVISYIKVHSPSDGLANYSNASWLSAIVDVPYSLGFLLGSFLEKKLGSRLTALIGAGVIATGLIASYISVNVSYILWCLTYAGIVGIGSAMSESATVICSSKWLRKNYGLSLGLSMIGCAIGPFLFSAVETVYVNPTNISPNSKGLFTDAILLNRVPALFIVLAATSASLQILGSILLINKRHVVTYAYKVPSMPDNETQDNVPLLSRKSSRHYGSVRAIDRSISNMPIKSVVCSTTFWSLWLTRMLVVQPMTFVDDYFKTYGGTFTHNDIMLAALSSTMAIVDGFGTVFWGYLADKFSYQVAGTLSFGLMAFFLGTICMTRYAPSPIYFIWICVICFGTSSEMALFDTAAANAFGFQNVGRNAGLLSTSITAGTITISILTTCLLRITDYCGMFQVVAFFGLISLILTLTITRTRYGAQLGKAKCDRLF